MKSILRSPYRNEGVSMKPVWKQYYEIVKLYFSLNYMPYEYYCFRFHHKDCSDEKILSFLPYSWFLYNVNLKLTPDSWSCLFNNKLLFNIYGRNSGLAVPVDFGIFNIYYGYDLKDSQPLRDGADLEQFFRKHRFSKVVIKDLSGTQGKNIFFVSEAEYATDSVLLTISGKKYTTSGLAALLGEGEFLFQEELRNNEFINGIYPGSLNTCRVITYLTKKNDVRILGTFLRTGMGMNQVDNWHAGGLLIPIDSATGAFIDFGYDYAFRLFDDHPDTGFRFRGNAIPGWSDLLALAEKGARAFPMMGFIAWDFAFTDKGLVVVESNTREINIFVNQLSDRGMSGIIREDLKEIGFDFPEKEIPPVTFKKIRERVSRVTRNLLHLGY